VAAHERTGAEGTIALHRVVDPSAFGVVPTDADGRVTAFIEKPPRQEAPTDRINAGTYVLEPSVLDRIEPDVPVNVERVTFPAMVADGSLYALDGDTYWLDAGTPATYLAANLDLITGRRGAEPGVHPDAAVDGAVAGSVVGELAQVGEGAIVSGSVLLPGSVVGAGALVQGAIIGARARVGEGAVVDGGAVLGDDIVVGPGDEVHGTNIPEES
jgi:mannose-1-phosphate guanylyltransferase